MVDAAYELKKLRVATAAMREHQIAYFRTKSRDALARAKECETRVDKMLSDMMRAEQSS